MQARAVLYVQPVPGVFGVPLVLPPGSSCLPGPAPRRRPEVTKQLITHPLIHR